ncbi:MAG: hypothetical protein ABH883_01640 [Candidatus Omnitrophota bacterium]
MSLPKLLETLDSADDGASFSERAAPDEVSFEKEIPLKKTPVPDPARAFENRKKDETDKNDHPESRAADEKEDAPISRPVDISSFWKAVLNYVNKKKVSVQTFLSAAKPLTYSDKKVVFGFTRKHNFNKEVLETSDNRAIVDEAVSKIMGCTPKVEYVIIEDEADTGGGGGKNEERLKKMREKENEEIKPVIEQVMDVFGGHVVRDYREESE